MAKKSAVRSRTNPRRIASESAPKGERSAFLMRGTPGR